MKNKIIHIRISDENNGKLDTLAKRYRRKKQEIVTIALENYFKSRKT